VACDEQVLEGLDRFKGAGRVDGEEVLTDLGAPGVGDDIFVPQRVDDLSGLHAESAPAW